MPTLTYRVLSDGLRKDGTYNVKFIVSHRGTRHKYSSPFYVAKEYVTRALKIRDARIIDACEVTLIEWRRYIAELGMTVESLSAKELTDYLVMKSGHAKQFRLDFIKFMRDVAKEKIANTAHNYINVANSLERYTKRRGLDIAQVTSQMLYDYERWLQGEGIANGTIYLYMTFIKAAHNRAKLLYNDEDKGVIRVPQSPFSRYTMPRVPMSKKRGVDLLTLQRIADIPDVERAKALRNIVRDVFMLSFALGGMNMADIYDIPYEAYNGEYIEYNRTKTAGSRGDDALFRVRVEECVRPLFERYRDTTHRRLFHFYLRYATRDTFVISIARGMEQIERAAPFRRHYTHYAARHTYATLARNVVGADLHTVHELLNHAPTAEMRITDRYVERDWSRLFDIHSKVVQLVDWTEICRERG